MGNECDIDDRIVSCASGRSPGVVYLSIGRTEQAHPACGKPATVAPVRS